MLTLFKKLFLETTSFLHENITHWPQSFRLNFPPPTKKKILNFS